MKLLLDTHVLIYATLQQSNLSNQAKEIIQDKANELYLSTASIWEMQIKLQLGKLNLQPSLQQIIEDQCRVNDLRILPISQQHIFNLSQLPFHHKDPFDRMIISQAMTEGFSLLSKDAQITKYQVNVIW